MVKKLRGFCASGLPGTPEMDAIWDPHGTILGTFFFHFGPLPPPTAPPDNPRSLQPTKPLTNQAFKQPSLPPTKSSTNPAFNQPSLQPTKPSTNPAFNQPTLQPTPIYYDNVGQFWHVDSCWPPLVALNCPFKNL